jgi:glycosyltransferase involved in cell wall biosynthesis
MGRVLVEALCRGRPVVASRVGGIRDVVEDGVNGILAEPQRPAELAEALARLLSERALSERLGAGAHASSGRWAETPEGFAQRMLALVDLVGGEARPSAG